MPKKTEPLPFYEFVTKHEGELLEIDVAAPDRSSAAFRMGARLEKPATMPAWLVGILKAAAREDCPTAFASFLQAWLEEIGAKPSENMLIELRIRGTRGRPRSTDTERIYAKWISIGRPSIHKNTLARAVYGKTFNTGDTVSRKHKVDRCRRTIERCQNWQRTAGANE